MKMFPGYIRYFVDIFRIHSSDSWFNALFGLILFVFIRVIRGSKEQSGFIRVIRRLMQNPG